MQRSVDDLARLIVEKYKTLSDDKRILVGVAGEPGAGKSTIAFPVIEQINELLGIQLQDHTHIDKEQALASRTRDQSNQIAISVSLDGWHTTRADLDRMPDPAEARRRRGAAFTFDAADYVSFVQTLRQTPLLPSIPYRTFSHSKKDPEVAPHPILPQHRIIIIEGLYVLLSSEPWDKATSLLDERVWVECPPEVARNRLIERHLQSGIEPDRASAEARVDGSDMLNGQFIREHLAEPTFTINSVVDLEYVQAVEGRMSAGETQ